MYDKVWYFWKITYCKLQHADIFPSDAHLQSSKEEPSCPTRRVLHAPP